MTVFSWELAEALALAHMKQIGFPDAKSTGSGADGGLDVVSLTAAAQVKAWNSPVGAPELQKLKGAAHSYERILFYALSGYTAQAEEYAASVGIALFTFSPQNTVQAVNETAISLERELTQESAYANAALQIQGLQFEMQEVSDLSQVAVDWLTLSPFIHMVPNEYHTQRVERLTKTLMGLSVLQMQAAAVSATMDPASAKEIVENGKGFAQEVVMSIDTNLDIDLEGLSAREAAKALRESLEGDTARLRIGELKPGLERNYGQDFEAAWRFLLPVIRLVTRIRKFLKLANQMGNKGQAELSVDIRTDPRSRAEFELLGTAVGKFQAWSDGIISSGDGSILDGEKLFLEVVEHFGSALSPYGIQGSEILATADAKPASWAGDDETDEE